MKRTKYGIVDLMLLGIEQDRIRGEKMERVRAEAERRKAEFAQKSKN